MTAWPQKVVHSTPRGRIVVMDSVGYVDERNDVTDVLICGSHGAPCATQLAVWLRPRGLICHDAGIGLGEGGVAGLKLLEAYLIPGAMVEGQSARISDGLDMYEAGRISRANRYAAELGVQPGMTTREAARLMLEVPTPFKGPPKKQVLVHDSALGKVFALDTVKYADERIRDGVLCMGSHAAPSMARYVKALGFPLAGVITNDAGMAKERSGVAGLPALDAEGVPAAAVSCATARMGDAISTYRDGLISALNEEARKIGIAVGMPAREAAERMLTRLSRKAGH